MEKSSNDAIVPAEIPDDAILHLPPPPIGNVDMASGPLVWNNGDGTSSKFVPLEDGDDSEADEADDIPIENVNTPQLMQEVLEKWRPRIGHCFAKNDDFETFMKLPIPIQSRMTILQTMIKTSQSSRRTRKRRAQSEIKCV